MGSPATSDSSLLSATFELIGCGIKIFSRLFYLAPLFVLGGGTSPLSAFSKEQLDSISLLLLRINDNGAAISLAFFGFSTLLQGWLIYKSGFLPRWLGVIAMIAGCGWLTFLSPPLGMRLFMYLALWGLIGVVAMIGWLLTIGVDDEQWRQRAVQAKSSIWT